MTQITLSASVGDAVLYTIEDRVGYITLNRPEARNAMNDAVRQGLVEAFADASLNPDVWVVIVSGAGDKAFCAGGDLKSNDQAGRSGRPDRCS
jgi:enoyl-CoA hydratase/carnithine racemase